MDDQIGAHACLTCMGRGKVMVGMSYPPNKTIAVKAEYDPCPDCTPPPHTFHARRQAQILKEMRGKEPSENKSFPLSSPPRSHR